jgi:hypothetical protein
MTFLGYKCDYSFLHINGNLFRIIIKNLEIQNGSNSNISLNDSDQIEYQDTFRVDILFTEIALKKYFCELQEDDSYGIF